MGLYVVDPTIVSSDGYAIVDPMTDMIDNFGETIVGDPIDIQFIDGKWFTTGIVVRLHTDDFGMLWEVDVDWDGARAVVVESGTNG